MNPADITPDAYLAACTPQQLMRVHMLIRTNEYQAKMGLQFVDGDAFFEGIPSAVADRFVDLVGRLKKDADTYANSAKVSQKALDYKLMIIDVMVDFYNEYEAYMAMQEMALMEYYYWYWRFRDRSERLSLFCTLHDISPNVCAQLSMEDLDEMLRLGIRIHRPLRRLSPDRISAINEENERDLQELSARMLHIKKHGSTMTREELMRERQRIIEQEEKEMPMRELLNKYFDAEEKVNMSRRPPRKLSFNTAATPTTFPS